MLNTKINKVLNVVGEYYQLPAGWNLECTRMRKYMDAKYCAYYYLYHEMMLTQKCIAEIFSCERSSVTVALNTFSERMKIYETYAETYQIIKNKLKL